MVQLVHAMNEDPIIEDAVVRHEKVDEIIKRLLAAKGIDRYVIYYDNEEASRRLPGGIYPYSGELLAGDGRIYNFWLDWDENKQDYSLGEHRTYTLDDGSEHSYWEEADPSAEFDPQSPFLEAYLRARRKLGLK